MDEKINVEVSQVADAVVVCLKFPDFAHRPKAEQHRKVVDVISFQINYQHET